MSLRVCLDARLQSGIDGGVQQVVLGLAHGLSQLDDGDEEYHFLTYDGGSDWLRPHLRGRCRELVWGPPPPPPGRLRQQLARHARLRAAWQWIRHTDTAELPQSTGLIEQHGMEVMHFTFQSAFVTEVPSIYQPHDLQHRHLPEYFSPVERRLRDARYRAFCERAAMVAVTSKWVKADLIDQYQIPAGKIAIIHWAPPTDAYRPAADADLQAVRQKFDLPEEFVFYPAQTWPHKNHVGLLRALAELKDEGLTVPLVSSGRQTPHYREIEREIRRLGLTRQVRFTGFVTPVELQALYQFATAAIIPTKFEAASYPVWEAFSAGVPVACSRVTSLPDQVGDSALTFDPANVREMASAIRRLWTDASLRSELIARGRVNVARFSWTTTARKFRAHYRKIAGRRLSSDDLELINAAPLL